MNKYLALEKRISQLEKYIIERTIGRNGEESNAYIIWKYLMENGPKTSDDIKKIFPASKQASIASALSRFPGLDLLYKNGNLYSANPDYDWDDIGVIRYTPLPEIEDEDDDSDDELEDEIDIEDITIQKDDSISNSDIDECNDAIFESFNSDIAKLQFDSQNGNKLVYLVKFKGYTNHMVLTAEIIGNELKLTLPYKLYDYRDKEVFSFEYKNRKEFTVVCNKIKSIDFIVKLLVLTINKISYVLDEV